MNANPAALKSYIANERLRDGRALLIRSIRPDDKKGIVDGLNRQHPKSLYFRFFQPKNTLSAQELVNLTEIDFCDHVALVATVNNDNAGLIVGVGRYIICQHQPFKAAEITFTVDDAHHGLGIATILLRHLTKIANSAGIVELRASVLPENEKMLSVFSHSGLEQSRSIDGGVVEFRFPLAEHLPAI